MTPAAAVTTPSSHTGTDPEVATEKIRAGALLASQHVPFIQTDPATQIVSSPVPADATFLVWEAYLMKYSCFQLRPPVATISKSSSISATGASTIAVGSGQAFPGRGWPWIDISVGASELEAIATVKAELKVSSVLRDLAPRGASASDQGAYVFATRSGRAQFRLWNFFYGNGTFSPRPWYSIGTSAITVTLTGFSGSGTMSVILPGLDSPELRSFYQRIYMGLDY